VNLVIFLYYPHAPSSHSLEMVTLDKGLILSVAKSRDIYETPELNDSLFLHGLGIKAVSPLPEYTHVEFLSLAENCLTSVSDLSQFPNLVFLNVSNNAITEIDIRLFPKLEQLHACHNSLTSFSVIEKNPTLKLVKLSHNKLTSFPDISNLVSLEVLDVAKNLIHEMDLSNSSILPFSLRQLYLSPNPFVARVRNYRKTILSEFCRFCRLSYLDNSFVTEMELAIANSSSEKENAIRQQFALSRRQELNQRVSDLRDLQLMFDENVYRICQEIASEQDAEI